MAIPVVVIHTVIKQSNTTIIAGYVEPAANPQVFEKYLDQIELILAKISAKNILLVGDFNAKSRLWGNNNINKRGQAMEAFISRTHSLVFAIKEYITYLEKRNNVIFLSWVRAHVSTVGNEMVDVAAKEASQLNRKWEL